VLPAGSVLVLGDSHAEVFFHPSLQAAFPLTRFAVCAVPGATASGLENPNAKTRAYQQFREALDAEPWDHVVVQLGEVDAGFVIWYRAVKYDASVTEMLEGAVSKYTAFLSEIVARGLSVTVVSCPLPTISDDNDWGEVANLRREVTATKRERTDLALRFNEDVARFCDRAGIEVVGLDADCLGPDGLLRAELHHPDPTNHHYDPMGYAQVLARRLS
jgi:hypothetical protein